MNRIITKYRISFITSNALDNEERSKSNSLYAYLLWIQNTFFFSEKTKQTTVYIFCWESNKTNSEEKRWIILRQIIFRNLKPNL